MLSLENIPSFRSNVKESGVKLHRNCSFSFQQSKNFQHRDEVQNGRQNSCKNIQDSFEVKECRSTGELGDNWSGGS